MEQCIEIKKNVKAILIGTSGVAAASIVAGKIEDKIEEVKIVSILSSEKIAEIDEYDLTLFCQCFRDLNMKIRL